MEEKIISMASNNGLWAVLFVVLLFYVLRETANRESKYQEIINKLTDKFNIIESVKDDVKEIKDHIFR